MICPTCQRSVKVLQIVFPSSKGQGRVSLQKCPACGHEWSINAPDQPDLPRAFDPYAHR